MHNKYKSTFILLLSALLTGGNAHAGVVVNGNVYGGGNAADVLTNSTVNITAGQIGGNTIDTDHGNVFGGGKGQNTVVQGNVEVNIGKVTDGNYSGTGTVKGSVYGGSAFGAVNAKKENNDVVYSGTNANPATTHVNIFSGTINDCVYGGGLGQTSPSSIAAQSFGDVTITMEGGSVANGVFGGSNVNGYLLSNATVTIKSGTIGSAPEQGDPIADVVFGGGFGKPTRVAGNVLVNIGIQDGNSLIGNAIINGNVYGGSAKGYVNGTTVSNNNTTTQVNLNKGTVIGDIYGGGLGYIDISDNTNDAEANVYGTVNVIVNDGTARDVFGCNNINGAPQQDVTVTINNTNATGITNVYGGGNKADMPGTVTVDINGGTITGDVYGGGALANTNTSYKANNAITTQNITTQVNLKGGTIKGNVYGGGLGQIGSGSGGGTGTGSGSPIADIPAYVYGNILVELNPGQSDACVIEGNIFGCNNQNGTPLGTVTVHVHRTHGWTDHDVTAGKDDATIGKTGQTYELAAVYGGGDLAAYEPLSVLTSAPDSTCVIIDGCDETSIGKVYGGGNAASTPATCVIINGTYEIGEVFGGGNGKDDITINGTPLENPGANVGYKAYPDEYGSGKAQVKIYGGTIYAVYGGSDTKGNIREEAVTLLDDLDENTCTFNVGQVYGGGKNAPLDGNIVMEMKCIPGLNTVYGGSDNADVNGNVTLNITNGKFLQVFGGNNHGGRVNGSITVNIEETGCQPIIIGELYGGGNEAPYSIYGYYEEEETVDEVTTTVLKPRPSLNYTEGSGPAIAYDHPQINIKSFTSIGNVFGGGYGEKAEMVGNPHVNINVGNGKYYNSADYAGETLQIDQNNSVTTPGHTQGKIGTIGTVFGGGNAAKVTGETYVYIGDKLGGNIEMETMELINGSKQTIQVLGADIIGNVYGGGNNAEVTGGTHVQIGPTPNPAPPVNNNNGGDDDGDSGDSGDSDNIGNNSQPVPQRDTRNAATEQLLNRTVTPIRQ